MPSQRRFEGPDLEALLARIRAEVGTGAEILEANKLRTGGVAGFFSKESFEVIVSVPDDDDPASAPRPVPPQATEADIDEPFEALSLLELAEHVSDREEASTFASALDGAIAAGDARNLALMGDEDPDPRPEVDRPARSRPLQAERHHATLADDELVDDEPFVPLLGRWPAQDAISAAEPASRPLAMARTEVGGLTAADRPARPFVNDAYPTARPVGRDTATHAVPYAHTTHEAGRRATHLAVPTPGQRERAVDRYDLSRLGIPADLAACVRGDESASVELLRLLERLPQAAPAPTAKGSVIAVVGDRDDALELAALLAVDLGQRPDDIIVAAKGQRAKAIPADRRLDDAAHADAARRAWRRRGRPTLVAVDAPVARDRWIGGWALDVLDALEPSMVWGTVAADRKPEDITAWADGLGGLDALGVTHLEATSSPAAVLGCGIPVGRIDGATATPARWAALLTERLAAA